VSPAMLSGFEAPCRREYLGQHPWPTHYTGHKPGVEVHCLIMMNFLMRSGLLISLAVARSVRAWHPMLDTLDGVLHCVLCRVTTPMSTHPT